MKENKYTAKSTVEAGLMSVIVFILLMMTTYVPFIGTVCFFILPVPIILLYLRHNKAVAILSIVVSTILISMFYDPIMAIATSIFYATSSLSLGFCISKGYKANKTLILTSTVNVIAIIMLVYISLTLVTKISLVQVMQQSIDMMKSSFDIYKGTGIDMNSNPAYQQMQQINVNTILFTIPATLSICSLAMALINYLVAQKLLKRFSYILNPIKNFKDWYLDNRVGAAIISIVCIGIILKSKGVTPGDYIFESSMMILKFALTVIGSSVAFYYLRNKFKVRNGIAIAICIYIVLSPISSIVFSIGLIDLVFDIRGLDPNSLGNALRKKFVKK